MAEWLKAAVLKTVNVHAFVGSNPTSSATKNNAPFGAFSFFGNRACRSLPSMQVARLPEIGVSLPEVGATVQNRCLGLNPNLALWPTHIMVAALRNDQKRSSDVRIRTGVPRLSATTPTENMAEISRFGSDNLDNRRFKQPARAISAGGVFLYAPNDCRTRNFQPSFRMSLSRTTVKGG